MNSKCALLVGTGLLSLPEAIAFASLDSAGISTITFVPLISSGYVIQRCPSILRTLAVAEADGSARG